MMRCWHILFLDERPSIGLAFFRISIALTVGFHVIPSFFHLDDNYYSTALKTVDTSFFTRDILSWVSQSPDWLVLCCVWLFIFSWLGFLVGWRTQLNALLLTTSCYYFYALNPLHIGTLSWDILLVTLVLMCVTSYPGDYFSFDALRSKDPNSYRRLRPFFIQRLLQIQIACIFFYTALYKITSQGNWLTGNPLYYLMNNPPGGVIKNFLFKEWIASQPQFCYWVGIFIILCELSLPFILFIRRTRRSAMVYGCIFHLILLLTMDVPAIFFFLFPAQLMLFINPQDILRWIEEQRAIHALSPRLKILFDGSCGFCRNSMELLKVMDLFNRIDFINVHTIDVSKFHPQCSLNQALQQMYLLEPNGKLSGGFYAFRRLCWYVPMLYPFLFLVYAPGAGPIGQLTYRWIANNRFLFHSNKICTDHGCHR